MLPATFRSARRLVASNRGFDLGAVAQAAQGHQVDGAVRRLARSYRYPARTVEQFVIDFIFRR